MNKIAFPVIGTKYKSAACSANNNSSSSDHGSNSHEDNKIGHACMKVIYTQHTLVNVVASVFPQCDKRLKGGIRVYNLVLTSFSVSMGFCKDGVHNYFAHRMRSLQAAKAQYTVTKNNCVYSGMSLFRNELPKQLSDHSYKQCKDTIMKQKTTDFIEFLQTNPNAQSLQSVLHSFAALSI